ERDLGFEDGVCGGEDGSRDGNEGEFGGFAALDKALEASGEAWAVSGSGKRGDTEGASDVATAAGDAASAAPVAGFAVERSQPERAAMVFPERRPSSGSNASRIVAATGPTPGTERSSRAARRSRSELRMHSAMRAS